MANHDENKNIKLNKNKITPASVESLSGVELASCSDK